MRVEQLGEGTPEVAVVGAVHGDEPCGARAVERLLEARPPVRRPVRCVLANEEALARGVRYVEADLNRSFPGDPDGPTHEARLAARLAAELEACVTLSLHSTQSTDEPFAVVSRVDDLAERVLPGLSVDAAVHAGDHVDGRLFATSGVVEVECGRQGSAAAVANAHRLTREFLEAVDALDDVGREFLRSDADPDAGRGGADPDGGSGGADPVAGHDSDHTDADRDDAGRADAGRAGADREPVPLFRLTRRLPKVEADDYEVLVENFRRVEPGQPYAVADGERLVAEEPFYPVLLSARGYEDIFGYAARRVGTLP